MAESLFVCSCPECVGGGAPDETYQQRLRRMRQEAEERVAREQQAQTRGLALLRGYLTRAQRLDSLDTGSFNVRASDGRLYRISVERSSENVVDQRGNARTMGFYTYGTLPPADLALALKFLFSTPEGPEVFERGGYLGAGYTAWQVPPACSSGPMPGTRAPDDRFVVRFYRDQGEPELATVTNPYPLPQPRDPATGRFRARLAGLEQARREQWRPPF